MDRNSWRPVRDVACRTTIHNSIVLCYTVYCATRFVALIYSILNAFFKTFMCYARPHNMFYGVAKMECLYQRAPSYSFLSITASVELFRVVKCAPSLDFKVTLRWIRPLLCDLRRVATSLAAWSSATCFRTKTSKYDIIFAPLVIRSWWAITVSWILSQSSFDWDPSFSTLLRVLHPHVLLPTIGSGRVHNSTSRLSITASGPKETSRCV